MSSNQCLLFESKVHVGKSVSSCEGVHRPAKWKKNAVAYDMKSKTHQNCYNSIPNAMRNAGAMTEATVEGRSTIGKVSPRAWRAGLRSRSRDRGCSRLEWTVLLGVGVYWSRVELVNICGLRLRPGVAGYHPSTVDDFGRTVVYRLENTEW